MRDSERSRVGCVLRMGRTMRRVQYVAKRTEHRRAAGCLGNILIAARPFATSDGVMVSILVGVDGSEVGERAEAWAAQLAAACAGELEVATVWPSRPFEDASATTWDADIQRTESQLAGPWSERARRLGARVTTRLLTADTPDGLLDEGDRLDADLIVIGTRQQRRFAGLRLGSFADWIAHRTNRPLAIIPASARSLSTRRLLLGLDSDGAAAFAVDFCAALARQLGADVDRVACVPTAQTMASSPTCARAARPRRSRTSKRGRHRSGPTASTCAAVRSSTPVPHRPCSESPMTKKKPISSSSLPDRLVSCDWEASPCACSTTAHSRSCSYRHCLRETESGAAGVLTRPSARDDLA